MSRPAEDALGNARPPTGSYTPGAYEVGQSLAPLVAHGNFPNEFDNSVNSQIWAAASQYITGSPNANTTSLGPVGNDITQFGLDATDGPIFDSYNWVAGAMQIVFPNITPGDYVLNCYFREPVFTAAGSRIISSLDANGTTIATNVDVYDYGLANYAQANAGYPLSGVITVDSGGTITVDIAMSVGNAFINAVSWSPAVAPSLSEIYLNGIADHVDGFGVRWIDMAPYITNGTPRTTTGPNSGDVYRGDVTQLDPPLADPQQVFLVDEAYYSPSGQNGLLQIRVPGCVPGSWTVGYYAAQYNNPPIDPRDYTLNVQGQSSQYIDLSGINEARSLRTEINIVDEGSGSGELALDIVAINDLSTISALSAIRRTGTTPQINVGGDMHEAGADRWVSDAGLYATQNQNALTYGGTVTGLSGVGLVEGQDESLLQIYRRGFDPVNGGHSLFYTLAVEAGLNYQIRIYSFEPSTSANSIGDRVVDVYIDDALFHTYDILSLAGDTKDLAVLTAFDFDPVGSGEQSFTLEFRGRTSGADFSPIVSAIEWIEDVPASYESLLDQNGMPILDQTDDPLQTISGAPNNAQGSETSPTSVDTGQATSPISALIIERSPASVDSGIAWRVLQITGAETSPVSLDSGQSTSVTVSTGAEISPVSIDSGQTQVINNATGGEISPISADSGLSFAVNSAIIADMSPISVDFGETLLGVNAATGAETSPISRDAGQLVHGTQLWVPVVIETTTPWSPS